MRTRTWLTVLGICAGLLGVTQVASERVAAQQPQKGKLVVVVARALGVRDIELGTLKRAFRGETTELAGKRLVPLNYPTTDPVRRSFDLQVLSMAPDVVGSYWVDRRIRGMGQPPHNLPTPAVVLAMVQKLPGAIGYITATTVSDAVQVLTIGGRGVNDASYPLKAPTD